MTNKFVAALKPKAASEPMRDDTSTVDPPSPAPSIHARPSRRSAKHIGGYFDPAVSKQLRQIALEEDSSVQKLMGEALDMLFQSRRKPTIASVIKK